MDVEVLPQEVSATHGRLNSSRGRVGGRESGTQKVIKASPLSEMLDYNRSLTPSHRLAARITCSSRITIRCLQIFRRK